MISASATLIHFKTLHNFRHWKPGQCLNERDAAMLEPETSHLFESNFTDFQKWSYVQQNLDPVDKKRYKRLFYLQTLTGFFKKEPY